MVFDDGTTSRLGAEHFLLTSTTTKGPAVLEHMEFHLQANCPGLDVPLTDVGDQWAQFAVAGPKRGACSRRWSAGSLSTRRVPLHVGRERR